jgi:hypothetical protein
MRPSFADWDDGILSLNLGFLTRHALGWFHPTLPAFTVVWAKFGQRWRLLSRIGGPNPEPSWNDGPRGTAGLIAAPPISNTIVRGDLHRIWKHNGIRSGSKPFLLQFPSCVSVSQSLISVPVSKAFSPPHSFTALSELAEARVLPSGENATE